MSRASYYRISIVGQGETITHTARMLEICLEYWAKHRHNFYFVSNFGKYTYGIYSGAAGEGERCCEDQGEAGGRPAGDHPRTQAGPGRQRTQASEQQAGVGERAAEPTATTGAGGGFK